MSAIKEHFHNEIVQNQEKSWGELTLQANLNLFGIQFARAIEEEINKINSNNGDEYHYVSCIAYMEGLKKGLELFKNLKEKQ